MDDDLLARFRAHLDQRLASYRIPPSLRDGLREYLAARRPTGSFLRACLENDLTNAINRADARSQVYLLEIVMFLQNVACSQAWGSASAVRAWLDATEPPPMNFD